MHLAVGREPRTSKNKLIGDTVGDLQEKGGGRGTSERTVRAAIDRWEEDLLAERSGKDRQSLDH